MLSKPEHGGTELIPNTVEKFYGLYYPDNRSKKANLFRLFNMFCLEVSKEKILFFVNQIEGLTQDTQWPKAAKRFIFGLQPFRVPHNIVLEACHYLLTGDTTHVLTVAVCL